MKKENWDSMFQRPKSEPSQKQEKKSKVNTCNCVKTSHALRSVVGQVSSTMWTLETAMKLKSFCIFSPNVQEERQVGPHVHYEGVEVCALTWRECSDNPGAVTSVLC